ncbi:MAG: DUF418 domain-containing protein [Muribaculaceae bacterium]|nr:DUF418 domain-containing protein [Muribaculaceae bacterium]
MTPTVNTNSSSRIASVDALRGFALTAIVLLHCIEHYNLFCLPQWQPQWLNTIDSTLTDTIWFLLAGKAYATFSLLFGFSFYIQLSNARKRGCDFRMRFAWRLLLLAGFAQLHALFYNGDILLFYAFCGLILIPASSWSNRTIITVAALLLLQPINWAHMITALVDPSYIDLNSRFARYATQAEAVGMHGTLLQTLADNIGNGQLYSNFWQIEAGRITQTPGLFLLGMWLGRRGMFVKSAESTRFWRVLLISSLAAFGPVYLLKELIAPTLTNTTWICHYGIALGLPLNAIMMAALVSVFMLAWFARDNNGYRFQRLLIPFGRMSLTNYITQSVIGVILFYNFGFGLYRYCGATLSALIGVAIVTILTVLSRRRLASHRQGPLEALWKRLTWL